MSRFLPIFVPSMTFRPKCNCPYLFTILPFPMHAQWALLIFWCYFSVISISQPIGIDQKILFIWRLNILFNFSWITVEIIKHEVVRNDIRHVYHWKTIFLGSSNNKKKHVQSVIEHFDCTYKKWSKRFLLISLEFGTVSNHNEWWTAFS